mgnify:CR=1 FL=1
MTERANGEASMEEPTSPSEDSGFAPCGRIESHPRASTDDPFRPRWMDIADPCERQCAHIVLKHGDAMPQRELMNMFDLKAGSLSEVLTKIERDGFIERTLDPQDRRQRIVRLTEAGHEQAVLEQRGRERFRAEALACLDADERAQLEDMLHRIKQHWKQIEPDMKGDCACSRN